MKNFTKADIRTGALLTAVIILLIAMAVGRGGSIGKTPSSSGEGMEREVADLSCPDAGWSLFWDDRRVYARQGIEVKVCPDTLVYKIGSGAVRTPLRTVSLSEKDNKEISLLAGVIASTEDIADASPGKPALILHVETGEEMRDYVIERSAYTKSIWSMLDTLRKIIEDNENSVLSSPSAT